VTDLDLCLVSLLCGPQLTFSLSPIRFKRHNFRGEVLNLPPTLRHQSLIHQRLHL
jgi:hypothetical protein